MSQNGSEWPTTASKAIISTETEGNIPYVFTKLCHIVKRRDIEGYGFNLHSEKSKPGQFIGKVDSNSPAELAGLKEGDRIVEVNGVPIGSESHNQVVQRIKAMSCEVRLLLIDVEKLDSVDMENLATVQNIPSSANISSISMTSTKRDSGTSNKSHGTISHNIMILNEVENGTKQDPEEKSHNNNNLNVKATSRPLSTDFATAAVSKNNTNGSLQLPTTAAEMRAKLLSKKKYDPKNESVDLKKKFEIIQKL